MPERITPITTVRTPDGLFTLSIREKMRFDMATDKPADPPMLTEVDGPYEVVMSPLDPQTKPTSAAQKRLLASWEALRHVRGPDASVQTHVSWVLEHTVPVSAPGGAPVAPLWGCGPRPVCIPATAAHPRAFRGTKYKPPSDKTPTATDLQPSLCDADGLARLTAALYPNGVPENRAAALADARRQMALPQLYRLFLWSSPAHESGGGEPDRFLSLFRELSLERHPQLLAAVALLVKRQPTANTEHWCRIIVAQPEEWRLTFAALLAASDAFRVEAAQLPSLVLSLFWEVQTGPYPVYRLFQLFRAMATGQGCEYMASGFRLADRLQPDYPFSRVGKSGHFPEPVVAALIDHLRDCDDYHDHLILVIWRRCGELPGLGRVLKRIQWERYAPDVAYQSLWLFMDYSYDDLPPDRRAAKCDWVSHQAGHMDGFLQGVPPEYRMKCVSHLRDFLRYWDSPQALTRVLPTVFTLLQRLCRPPYRPMCDTADVTCDFLGPLQGDALARFLGAPDAGFLRLEEACRLGNNTHLIGRGTRSLTRHLPEFSVDCFLNYPAKLFKVAKRLGGLPEAIRERVVREFGLSPLMDGGLADKDPSEAVAAIQANRQEGVFNPVPRRLQEHLAGRRTLTDLQLTMSQAQTNRQLALTRLETLERAALTALQGAFDADPAEKSVSHALTIYHSGDENRRALRKFLKAHWAGRQDYLVRHPLNQEWLARHPEINAQTWQQGIASEGMSAAHGPLRLTVEQDPLEALKLGTHVGSCLGVGGSFVFSAVAAALDINKQVVYARDLKGTVVARQLLSVSEQNQIVCYSVYPYTIAADIRRMFADYDRRFAEALGVSLYTAGEADEYVIETVLSHNWWDDCAWDFQDDQEPLKAQSGSGV